MYPPVSSLPEFQSLGSPETTEKEIGTVSPKQVRLGNMLGKAQSRENRCVGGQMGPGSTPGHKTRPTAGRWAVCTEPHRTSAPALPGTSEPAARSGGQQWNECCQSTAAATEANPGGFGGLFGCSRRLRNKPAQKIFFRSKHGHMAHTGTTRTSRSLSLRVLTQARPAVTSS